MNHYVVYYIFILEIKYFSLSIEIIIELSCSLNEIFLYAHAQLYNVYCLFNLNQIVITLHVTCFVI